MKQNQVLAILISAFLAGGSLAVAKSNGPQENTSEARLARQAKITKEQAQETALKRATGTVESAELEREHRKLVYSFDIRNAKGTIDEVQVSAITGKIVRVQHENKQQEAEKRADQKKKN